MKDFGKIGERVRGAVAGASFGLNVIAATATATAGVLATSSTAEAQSLKTTFSSMQEANRYAQENSYIMVHTARNGIIFVTREIYERSISSDTRLRIQVSGSGIHYITSINPRTTSSIHGDYIIGGQNARVTIEEDTRGGDREEDTPEDTEDTSEDTSEDTNEDTI